MSPELYEKATRMAARPYVVALYRYDESDDVSGGFVAMNPELPGCMACGSTHRDTLETLAELRVEYIAHLLEHGKDVPLPSDMPVEIEQHDDLHLIYTAKAVVYPA